MKKKEDISKALLKIKPANIKKIEKYVRRFPDGTSAHEFCIHTTNDKIEKVCAYDAYNIVIRFLEDSISFKSN